MELQDIPLEGKDNKIVEEWKRLIEGV